MTASRIFAYGALGLPLAFAALPIYVHIPRYYADTTGLDLAILGAILLGARLTDAFVDPWLGWLADRLPRRRMLAVALLPFALGFTALLNPPQNLVTPWLIASLVLTYLGFSAASVAYQAWGAAMGGDSVIRTRLTAAREGFGLLGVVLAAALPGILANDLSVGTARLSWVLPPLLLLAAAITLSSVDGATTPRHPSTRMLGSLTRALADQAFVRLLVVFVANGIAAALPATLFLFFVADVLGAVAESGALLALYFVAGAVSLPLWVRLSVRLGRVRVWALSMLVAMLAFGWAALLGPGDLLPFAAICLASGLALGADLALPAAIAADLGERQEQAGVCFGIWNFVTKLNLALAAGLALPLLDVLGYRPGSDHGQTALIGVYALLPLTFKLLAASLLWRWRNSLEIRS
ncbi:MFS transporter [Dechloromonas sp. XY25]|uniref:MFS transporter n=1 Tax=Dechloromonas hankyongensis TaxID=2908002 RepID=A0ABS9K1F1_9RHOO|nr:MFS transporter [Dechloromonas hankyongensis]MCG2576983.1 MFS transporter [Dechloromonas hankyongensis]